jgi:metallopeptidase MepB
VHATLSSYLTLPDISDIEQCNNNVPLFKEVISLRQEKAALLGKPDYMTYKMQDSMLGSPDAVRKLLRRFRERVANLGVLESIKETKSLDATSKDKNLYLWDQHYYKRIWLEMNYSVDHRKIAEYFPIWSTVDGMLQLYGEMFGLDFQPVVGANVWHKDVKLFAVWDNTETSGEFTGYLYVDPLPRLGKYRGGKFCSFDLKLSRNKIFPTLTHTDLPASARCFELQPSFLTRSGERIYGASALVCNFSKSLHHGQVITLFHELGHGMHHLLSRAKYAKFHGSRFTKDFKEVPSIVLENWCWLPAQLKRLSRHCDTGATIPDDLVNNLARTKYFARVLDPLQVALATFDLVVYTPASQSEVDDMDPSEIYNKLLCEITGLEGPEPIAGVK